MVMSILAKAEVEKSSFQKWIGQFYVRMGHDLIEFQPKLSFTYQPMTGMLIYTFSTCKLCMLLICQLSSCLTIHAIGAIQKIKKNNSIKFFTVFDMQQLLENEQNQIFGILAGWMSVRTVVHWFRCCLETLGHIAASPR